MKPEQQRIAIAKACGWQFIPDYCNGEDQPPEFTTVTPEGQHLCGYYPDYLRDLNAMQSASVSLDDVKHDAFQQHLLEIVKPGTHWSDMHMTRIVSATAAQRAEAFLKTLGLWEEE